MVGPYDFAYSEQAQDFSQFAWDLTQNRWSYVFDFTPPATGRSWRLMRPDEFPGDHFYQSDPFEEGRVECVVPRHVSFGGTINAAIVEGSPEQQEALDNLGQKPKEEVEEEEVLGKQGAGVQMGQGLGLDPFSAFEVPKDSLLGENEGSNNWSPKGMSPSIPNSGEGEKIRRLEEEESRRMEKVREKIEEELAAKRERKTKAQENLDKFREERAFEIKQRKELNKKANEAMISSENGGTSGQVSSHLFENASFRFKKLLGSF